jgi:hypothetical protein
MRQVLSSMLCQPATPALDAAANIGHNHKQQAAHVEMGGPNRRPHAPFLVGRFSVHNGVLRLRHVPLGCLRQSWKAEDRCDCEEEEHQRILNGRQG